MRETKYERLTDKYARRSRLFKLILGWFNIALALYLSGFSVYSLAIGKTDHLPQIAVAVVACLPAGISLVRSAGNPWTWENDLLSR